MYRGDFIDIGTHSDDLRVLNPLIIHCWDSFLKLGQDDNLQ